MPQFGPYNSPDAYSAAGDGSRTSTLGRLGTQLSEAVGIYSLFQSAKNQSQVASLGGQQDAGDGRSPDPASPPPGAVQPAGQAFVISQKALLAAAVIAVLILASKR